MPRQKLVTRYAIPLLGALGLSYAGFFTLAQANAPEAPPKQLNLPLESPYQHAISGSGLIEANTRNVVVGSYTAGIVQQVAVTEGDVVQAGAPLFMLDDRTAKADLAIRETELAAARAQHTSARVQLEDQKDQLRRAGNLTRGVSITTDRIERLTFAEQAAAAAVTVAEANVNAAQARLEAARVALAKLTMNAPVAGRVLKVNIRPGNFVEANGNQSPIVLGGDDPLYVRISIDENDLWRLKPQMEATGALRGNRDVRFPLTFVRIEPYVIPRKSLTGSTSERVDTRVIEVLYMINTSEKPLYIGQLVDVFIKADE